MVSTVVLVLAALLGAAAATATARRLHEKRLWVKEVAAMRGDPLVGDIWAYEALHVQVDDPVFVEMLVAKALTPALTPEVHEIPEHFVEDVLAEVEHPPGTEFLDR